jgi:hypothetical protein
MIYWIDGQIRKKITIASTSKNMAASFRQLLLNLSRDEGRVFDVVLATPSSIPVVDSMDSARLPASVRPAICKFFVLCTTPVTGSTMCNIRDDFSRYQDLFVVIWLNLELSPDRPRSRGADPAGNPAIFCACQKGAAWQFQSRPKIDHTGDRHRDDGVSPGSVAPASESRFSLRQQLRQGGRIQGALHGWAI